jgi:hypothetical protein
MLWLAHTSFPTHLHGLIDSEIISAKSNRGQKIRNTDCTYGDWADRRWVQQATAGKKPTQIKNEELAGANAR